MPSGDVEVVALPSGLHVVKLPGDDVIWARQEAPGRWTATARARVRLRVGKRHTYLQGTCHRGYHWSLEAAIRCGQQAMPRLRARADVIRNARAPHDREALGRIRKRRDERVGPGWQRIRRQVLSEEPVCPCGAPSVEVHHIIPVVLGGTSERDNLQALCKACHHPARKER